jgi:hypothetical protein
MSTSPFVQNPTESSVATTNVVASVATPSSVYERMSKKWELVEALRGGTEEMRKHTVKYLPQEPKETNEAYKVRLQRSFLFNLYGRTLTAITGLAFIKNAVVNNAPEELRYLESNFDGNGRSLTEVAYDLTIDAVHYGKCHAIADFPRVDNENMSLAEFRNAGYKPYITHVNPRNVIGWRTAERPGREDLQQVRITESKVVPSDLNEWADKPVFYVRVLEDNTTRIYKYDPEMEDSSYQLEDEFENTLGYIPIVTGYANKTGYMEALPAMYDLAELNLRHYQSSSDQNNILHVARVPFLFASGFDDGELNNAEIGAQRIIVSSNPDAKIGHVEHTGQAIGAGRTDLKDLETQMAALGADLLVSKGVSRMTATARRLDQNESMSTLQLALRSVEQAIEQLYIMAGDWIGVDASEVKVSIGEDMSVANEPNPTAALKVLMDTGLLTDQQVVEEAKRQGILSSYFKLEEDRPRNKVEEYSEDIEFSEIDATDDLEGEEVVEEDETGEEPKDKETKELLRQFIKELGNESE